MTDAQVEALRGICKRYHVTFREEDYRPAFDLPDGYVAGWVGGPRHGMAFRLEGNGLLERTSQTTIYVGVSPEGEISS